MCKRWQLMVGVAALGLTITATLFAYLEFTNYSPLKPTFIWAAIILCPPSLMSVAFIDAEPHTSGIAIVWLTIGLFNSAFYGAIGAGVGKYLWKSD